MGDTKMTGKIVNWLYRWRLIPWIVMALTLVAVGAGHLIEPKPPLVFHNAVGHPPELRVGERATITYESTRNRPCKADIALGWIDSLGSVAMRLDPIQGGLGRVGRQTNSITVPVPDLPGRYCFRLVGQHYCGGDSFAISAPEACLDVRL